MSRRQRHIPETIFFTSSLAVFAAPAMADGLGGLSAIGLLLYILMSPLPLSLIVIAFIMRSTDKPRATRIFAILATLVTLLFVLWAKAINGRSGLQSFNPWWDSDSAVVAAIALLLILGNLMFYAHRLWMKGLLVLLMLAFLGIQFVGTPGRAIYYDHDPLQGQATTLKRLDLHHIAWNDRILHSASKITCCGRSQPATVELTANGKYRITEARRNRDPRIPSSSSSRRHGKWEIRYPYQPSHVAAVVTEDAILLDADWRADAGMLIDSLKTHVDRQWLAQMISRGADPNYVDANGMTPLLVSGGNLPWLVELGADPNLRLAGGDTPLHRVAGKTPAAWNKMKNLIEAGADPTLRNRVGDTALDLIERYLRRNELRSSDRSRAGYAAAMIRKAIGE